MIGSFLFGAVIGAISAVIAHLGAPERRTCGKAPTLINRPTFFELVILLALGTFALVFTGLNSIQLVGFTTVLTIRSIQLLLKLLK